jgi:hypothetical protein
VIDILFMILLDHFSYKAPLPYEPTGNEFIEWTGVVR